ncbi:MAG: hypothetical protein IPL65_13815 [Lewinellaceae bacterium]|nr:hypothetical protein [Lewinellaceae bacterium]
MHKSALLLLLMFSAFFANAQKDLPDENVNIIKDFDARLLESNSSS